MNPSKKSQPMESAIKRAMGFDRRTAIILDLCQPEPIGCGGDATEFADELSRAEYRISGLCQKCQDQFFSEDFP